MQLMHLYQLSLGGEIGCGEQDQAGMCTLSATVSCLSNPQMILQFSCKLNCMYPWEQERQEKLNLLRQCCGVAFILTGATAIRSKEKSKQNKREKESNSLGSLVFSFSRQKPQRRWLLDFQSFWRVTEAEK